MALSFIMIIPNRVEGAAKYDEFLKDQKRIGVGYSIEAFQKIDKMQKIRQKYNEDAEKFLIYAQEMPESFDEIVANLINLMDTNYQSFQQEINKLQKMSQDLGGSYIKHTDGSTAFWR